MEILADAYAEIGAHQAGHAALGPDSDDLFAAGRDRRRDLGSACRLRDAAADLRT